MPEAMDPSPLELEITGSCELPCVIAGTQTVSSAGVRQALSTCAVPNACVLKTACVSLKN